MDKKPRINPRDVKVILPTPKSQKRVEVKRAKGMVIDPKVNKYIKNKISGMSNKEAALKAGYTKSMAAHAAEKIETLEVKKKMIDLMDEAGLSDAQLVAYLKEGLTEANRIQGTGDNFVEIPDYGVRHKYLTTALEAKELIGGGKGSNKEPIQILIVDYESDKDKSTT